VERHGTSAHEAAIDFRRFVKDCARQPQLVECFNRACGVHLQAPIASLIDDGEPLQASEEEQLLISLFIVFVHENLWVRLKMTALRLEHGSFANDPRQ